MFTLNGIKIPEISATETVSAIAVMEWAYRVTENRCDSISHNHVGLSS